MKFARKPDFSQLPIVLIQWFRARRRRIELGADLVSVTERGLFAVESWSESPAAFTGVRRRAVMRGGVPMYHIDLRHPDRLKSQRLAGIRGLDASRAAWIEAARSLVLPTIDETPAGSIMRDAGEPDLPIRILAARGRVPVADLESAQPPFPLAFHGRDDGTVATDRLFRPGSAREVVAPVLDPAAAAALTLLLVVAGVLCWWDYPAENVLRPLLTVTRYVVCIGFVLLAAVLVVLAGERRHIAITPRSITVSSAFFGRRRQGVTIPLDTLHSVMLPKPKIPFGVCTEINLAAPDIEITIPGLTRRQAVWIGRLIMAAAAGREIAVTPDQPAAVVPVASLEVEAASEDAPEVDAVAGRAPVAPTNANPTAETAPLASREADPPVATVPAASPDIDPSAGAAAADSSGVARSAGKP